ncbi:protein YgfX [Glaciimonas soli]|uniref:Flagellar hook-length control protein n=1 Tax=Glaciimonas soli TaxID=2590999 RepID=A0A843YPG0_9BURK|nr:protein YgfX [Glaciimonas soli]MQR01699.1 flagellar hook-length control protein [Glaciimonas soli]
MSIAVSTRVYPSTILRMMVAMLCAAVMMVGVLIAFGVIGHLPLIVNLLIGMVSIVFGIAAWRYYSRLRQVNYISISHLGQIRVGDILSDTQTAPTQLDVAYLQSGSTLWSHLLLLRLRSDNGQMKTLIILPDSVSEDVFRSLSVALRWTALRQPALVVDHGI